MAHPLLGHIVRRLVWTAYAPPPTDTAVSGTTVSGVGVGTAVSGSPGESGVGIGGAGTDGAGTDGAGIGGAVSGGAGVAFRVAEDGSYADAADEAFELPDGATVGVAHPRRLGDQVGVWAAVFADYEILQPFAQLGRTVHELSADELASTNLARFTGLKVPTTTLLGLERRGWQRGEPQDAGVQLWIWRPTGTGRAIVLDLDPGIPIGAHDISPEQTITTVWINDRPWGAWLPRHLTRTFGELDDVTASEMLRDLTDILGR